jgi:hypothetical protein
LNTFKSKIENELTTDVSSLDNTYVPLYHIKNGKIDLDFRDVISLAARN